jgi:hypothetical protein
MKNWILCFFLMATVKLSDEQEQKLQDGIPPVGNVFIITTDGFRWQEIFSGADSVLINNEEFTPDHETIKLLYWDNDTKTRRRKLMPFLWSLVAEKGQLYGNRNYDNKVNVANPYSISYPGYNEIFTGTTDITIFSNAKKKNPNINLLEYLNRQDQFKGKVAAFTSWDVFPYILNEERSSIMLNSGYEERADNDLSSNESKLNLLQDSVIKEKKATRSDRLTFVAAKEYIQKNKPRVFYLGLGETDDFAHSERYDLYLQQATEVDKMIAELWHWVQTTPGYKDNTTFILTTDHGRGAKKEQWGSHGPFVPGSSQTWMAFIGPGIAPLGEVKDHQQLYQKQLSATIARVLGLHFSNDKPVASVASKNLK